MLGASTLWPFDPRATALLCPPSRLDILRHLRQHATQHLLRPPAATMATPPTYAEQKVTEPAPVVGAAYPQQSQPVYQAHTHVGATAAAGPPQPWANNFWDCLDPLDLCMLAQRAPTRRSEPGYVTLWRRSRMASKLRPQVSSCIR